MISTAMLMCKLKYLIAKDKIYSIEYRTHKESPLPHFGVSTFEKKIFLYNAEKCSKNDLSHLIMQADLQYRRYI